jgi:capsular polysaccharide biosynthesis protein
VRSLGRVLISQWFTMVAGLLLTVTAAALVFALVPPSYTSSGTVVVLAPARPTNRPANPLLAFNNSLDTIASILLQSLSSPVLPFRVGLVAGQDAVTVKNAGVGSSLTTGPFISITAQSPDAVRTPAIVSWVIDLARQDLADRQRALKVANRKAVTLGSVVDPTPAKPVWFVPVSATGGALLLGLMVTTAMAWSINWAETRKRHELEAVEPLEGVGYPPATRKPLPVTPAVRPAVAAVATGGRHFRQATTGTASSQPA